MYEFVPFSSLSHVAGILHELYDIFGTRFDGTFERFGIPNMTGVSTYRSMISPV